MYGYTKTLKATRCLEYRTINITTSIDNYNELHKREDIGDDAHSGFHHSDGTREGLLHWYMKGIRKFKKIYILIIMKRHLKALYTNHVGNP